jgi:hypothetical protein
MSDIPAEIERTWHAAMAANRRADALADAVAEVGMIKAWTMVDELAAADNAAAETAKVLCDLLNKLEPAEMDRVWAAFAAAPKTPKVKAT